MVKLSVRLPDSLHQQVRLLAQQEGISINQLIASAVGEKVSSLMTESYLAERAANGNKADFLTVMAKVPDSEPEALDKLK